MPVICPIAIAKGCAGCPFFNICPAKKLLGDEGKLRTDKNGDVKIHPTKPS